MLYITSQNLFLTVSMHLMGVSLVASVVKNPPVNAGDVGDVSSILGSRRSPGEGNDNPLQYSCLGIPTDRGADYSSWGHKSDLIFLN